MENRSRRRSLGYFDVTLMKYCTRIDSFLYHSRNVIKMVSKFMRLWKLEIIFVSTYSYLNLKIEEHDLFRFIMQVFSN